MCGAFLISIIVLAFFDLGVEFYVKNELRVNSIVIIVLALLGYFL